MKDKSLTLNSQIIILIALILISFSTGLIVGVNKNRSELTIGQIKSVVNQAISDNSNLEKTVVCKELKSGLFFKKSKFNCSYVE